MKCTDLCLEAKRVDVLIAHWPFFLKRRTPSIATLKTFVHYCIRENKMESNTKKSKSITTTITNDLHLHEQFHTVSYYIVVVKGVGRHVSMTAKNRNCLACKNCKLIFTGI